MFSLVLLAYLATVHAYVWPSPQLDELEALRFDQDGHSRRGIATFIEPCDFFLFSFSSDNLSGRSDAADWIRTAYHDMATHNVTDGTGGLDASIRFPEEQARAESTKVCCSAGPEVPFRGGRVDAGEPNAPGVPEPQEDLQAHIANFARQGFTQTEMIGLIACGHTFGGVQYAPFPDIVPELNDPNNTQSVAHFDSTFAHFDNNIATEYISGTTQNPLVVGLNDTTNSDKRIFGSDGNVTMQAFANSAELFASTCSDLFARMLNTVPRGVQLTEVITPLPVKPSSLQLTLAGDTLKLFGEVRFWNMTEDADRTVRLLWDDRTTNTHNATLPFAGLSSAAGGRHSAAWYTLNTTEDNFLSLDANAGITNMRFSVNSKLEDQGGVGFAVQDGVVFSETSCTTSVTESTGRFDVAVRNGLIPTRVYLEQESRDSVQRPIIIETELSPPTEMGAADAAYSIWSINVTSPLPYTIAAEVGGVKLVINDGSGHALFDLPACAS
ncbi:heme peroxidase [Mycena latifolia]|nr:heme peroxidase [Mycena latifolia]